MANTPFDWHAIIQSVGGYLGGFLSSLGIEWYRKRKSKPEEKADVTEGINKAALDNVITAQKVSDMLEERLLKDKEYYEERMDQSKKDCIERINELNEKQKILKASNEILIDKENRLERENQQLSVQWAKQITDTKDLQTKYDELKRRLNEHDQFITGDYNKLMP